MDISLHLKDEKLVKVQESDPHTQQLRKQWESNNLDKNMYTMENNIISSFWHTTNKATMASEEHIRHSKIDIIGKA